MVGVVAAAAASGEVAGKKRRECECIAVNENYQRPKMLPQTWMEVSVVVAETAAASIMFSESLHQ